MIPSWLDVLLSDNVTKTMLEMSRAVVNLCTLLQCRRQARNRYAHVDMPQLGVCFEDLETFQTAFADHDS